jgi:hypothetical protein
VNFFENRHRDDRAFLKTTTEITFTLEPQIFGHSESKDAMTKPAYYVTDCVVCNATIRHRVTTQLQLIIIIIIITIYKKTDRAILTKQKQKQKSK